MWYGTLCQRPRSLYGRRPLYQTPNEKSSIRKYPNPTLAKIAAYLKKNPGSKLQIEGHRDERGASEYNMAQGQRRGRKTAGRSSFSAESA